MGDLLKLSLNIKMVVCILQFAEHSRRIKTEMCANSMQLGIEELVKRHINKYQNEMRFCIFTTTENC